MNLSNWSLASLVSNLSECIRTDKTMLDTIGIIDNVQNVTTLELGIHDVLLQGENKTW